MDSIHQQSEFSFASDNYSGIHPQILAAIFAANGGHQASYGYDVYSQRLNELVQKEFGSQAQAFPVFNGTGANVTALQALLPRWGAVICATNAHIQNDESVAPERIGGFKCFTIDTPDGKLNPDLIAKQVYNMGFEHRAQPAVVYISQISELGTCYSIDELTAIAQYCQTHGLKLYIDGARLANAAAYLDCSLAEAATGADMLSLGGTKNGLMVGECIITLSAETADAMKYLRKMNMQLGSKMRFIAAQLIEWLETGLWRELAVHSNQLALKLAEAAAQIPHIKLTQPCQSNAVFATMPKAIAQELHEQYHFYDWNKATGEVRWMTAFDTTEEQVQQFIVAISQASQRYSS